MKRYEKMSKEEIVDLFVNGCSKCRAKEDCIAENWEINCRAMKKQWLNKDIDEMKLRIALINTTEELEKANRYGTFEQNEEPSYDIMVENFNGTGSPMLVKHVRESSCYDIREWAKEHFKEEAKEE